jgi:hypothetical protein
MTSDEEAPAVEQRAGTPRSERARTEQLWVPDGLPKGVTPKPTDAYVVIDDLADGVAVLSSAPWPQLDRAGRLAFRTDVTDFPQHFGRSQKSLQERVNELRDKNADPAIATRPVRIGDVFLIRGFSTHLGEWELLIDVTTQARTAAKIALFGAIAPRVSKKRADQLGLSEAAPAPSPPPSTGRSVPPGRGAAPAV